ncbi:hypothetical protein, variant [Fonticula alba]|uniref:Citrate synthase n=1 Tax=Fonticula alba TaxID=691883 RepID=A0A058ZFE2_FONAL|nr:hypothetical protein, variant [Fonticula alba]KCV72197.1 hypothetical protein, variant [Fonticula alba]|eukprot:XP_009493774.1 hypothetical protein, variant [Fonticula alba]
MTESGGASAAGDILAQQRLHSLANHLQTAPAAPDYQETLTVVDNRTGKTHTIPIRHGHIVNASDLAKITAPGPLPGPYPAPAVEKTATSAEEPAAGGGPGLLIFDPALASIAVAQSSISFVDGEKGILRYRGIPIEDIAKNFDMCQVAHLLLFGQAPATPEKRREWQQILSPAATPDNMASLARLIFSLPTSGHPMSMFISGLGAMSALHSDSNPALSSSGHNYFRNNPAEADRQIERILRQSPVLAALIFRRCKYRAEGASIEATMAAEAGRLSPAEERTFSEVSSAQAMASFTAQKLIDEPLARDALAAVAAASSHAQAQGWDYATTFLAMSGLGMGADRSLPPPEAFSKALDLLFVLHAEHELNCSTSAMRHISSSAVDPYSAVAGSASALYGPLHGGACEAVLRMLEEIGHVDQVPGYLEKVKRRECLLMGFGHRVYKNYDPRARQAAEAARDVVDTLAALADAGPKSDIAGQTFDAERIADVRRLAAIARRLEEVALNDVYFRDRKLFPNVDFWTGLLYKALGIPTEFFPVMFAMPRLAGWLSHWRETVHEKPAGRIFRPRQIYIPGGTVPPRFE